MSIGLEEFRETSQVDLGISAASNQFMESAFNSYGYYLAKLWLKQILAVAYIVNNCWIYIYGAAWHEFSRPLRML